MMKRLASPECEIASGKHGTQNASTLPLSPRFLNYCSFLGLKGCDLNSLKIALLVLTFVCI